MVFQSRHFLTRFVMAFVFFMAGCTAAPDRTQANPAVTAPTQAQPAPPATITIPPAPAVTQTATRQPTATPTATPAPSITPTLTPIAVPWDAISDANAGKMKPLFMLPFEADEHPLQMAFSPDGGILTVVSQIRILFKDTEGVIVSVRNAGTGEVLRQIEVPYEGLLHPDGLHFIAHDESKLYLYDLLSGQITSEQAVGSLEQAKLLLSPDGSYLVITRINQQLEIWDLNQGASAFKPADITYVHDVAFSQDGSVVALLVFQDAFVYTLKTGALVGKVSIYPWPAHGMFIIGDIALSPDGSTIAIDGSFDLYPAFVLWDVPSAAQVAVWSTRNSKADYRGQVIFSPDGTFVAASAAGKVFLFDGKTGALLRTLSGGMPLAFSPDNRVLSASTEKGDILLWGLEKGALLVTLRGHTQNLDAFAFHPQGQLLASSQFNAAVGLWGIPSAGMTSTRAGISMQQGVSPLSSNIPEAWRAGGGKPPRYYITVTLESAVLKSCPYTGNHTLILKQQNENVVITDLETNTVIARHTFMGQTDPNSQGCPLDRSFNTQTEAVFVTLSDYGGFSRWLETTMAPFGFVP